MRILVLCLVSFLLAASSIAQESPKLADSESIRLRAIEALKKRSTGQLVILGRTTKPGEPCSVPLLQAPVPGNVKHTIVEVPANDPNDGMPKAAMPAPPCGEPSLESAGRLTVPRR